MELLEAGERALVKAFIVNKFRGDVSLLNAGTGLVEARTGVPVAGVVPYYHDIYIAEEDSMALEKRQMMKNRTDFDLDIAVIGSAAYRQLRRFRSVAARTRRPAALRRSRR